MIASDPNDITRDRAVAVVMRDGPAAAILIEPAIPAFTPFAVFNLSKEQ